MAVVLSSEDSGFFSSSALKRSHSQSNFSKQASSLHTSASTSRLNKPYHDNYQAYHISPTSSVPSSAPSSPRTVHADSVTPSDASTPATTISLDGHWDRDLHIDTSDEIILPQYDINPFFAPVEELESPTSPHAGDSYSVSPAEHDTPTTTSRPESPTPLEHAEDDTAVRHHPTHHVDYLSHDWQEEDIWSSWRYIVSRRNDFTNASRLENASWRTWMKSKYALKTVSPETLNWLKDCDVTWLYGPLQTRQTKLFPNDTHHGSSTLSRNDSFMQKKPILKKRSMSEVMLQKSISTSSLLKQAAAAVQSQQQVGGPARIPRPILHRARTDFGTFPFASRRLSQGDTGLAPSHETSGLVSPSVEKKHIHFDEQVQQCIAVEVKGEEDEEEEAEHDYWNHDDDSDSSDDGVFMMKKTNIKRRPTKLRPRPRSSHSESKIIEMLPSTTLKYREDTPEPPETAMKHSTSIRSPPFISPSSSQETLRPSKQSGRFFVEDEEITAIDESGATPLPSPADGSQPGSGLKRTTSTGNLNGEPIGMRRTESGMLMPYEEGDPGNEGLIGRVIDTVNTARDIAHVIWNVGWRR